MGERTEADAVRDIMRASVDGRFEKVDGVTLFVGPDSMNATSVKGLLDEYRTAPERRKGTAVLSTLDSFLEHVKRFADADTAIFVDPKGGTMLAVLDYHRAGAGSPRFGEHRARYAFPLSDEWAAWTKASKAGPVEQAKFAEFIEDRIADIADPAGALPGATDFAALTGTTYASPSKLLELSRGLSIMVGRKVGAQVRLATGESTIEFVEEHRDASGEKVKIPGAFLLAIPVFKGGALYQVSVRLRYRVAGSVSWAFDLYRADAMIDHAIEEACAKVRAETKLPVFMGTPES